MSSLFENLAWLPRPPEDFRQRCRALQESENRPATPEIGRAISRLASCALDDSQAQILAKTIGRLRGQGVDLAPLVPFRLGVLGNGTLDLVLPALVAGAARFGVALECIRPDYNLMLQPAVTAGSDLHQARPDAVLLALDYRGLPWRLGPDLRKDTATNEIDSAMDFLAAIRAGIRSNSGVPCVVQTLASPAECLFGSLDRAIPGTPRYMIDQLNRRIICSLADTQDVLFDVAGLAETVGLAEWHVPTEWNMAKLPFAAALVPLYADHVGRVIGALRGKSRRCLILDLDNTLWGGVIGDDGLEGLSVAQGDVTGEAFLSVQRLAIDLRTRGIVLAICSKNEDQVARTGFTHPEMLLKLDQVAVFQANWQDKATNIVAIAQELSLGLDSMVFLDDNKVERELVRRILPEVAVPELPDDPALYARTLAAAGYFEAVTYSAEDRARADFYQDNARRITLQSEAGDVGAYLRSLDMTVTFQPFNATGRARITQLINKSNQFNLTTRRYTESEVAAAEADCFTLQIRLADRFSDNGMISVVICRDAEPGVWEIETWLMSCRVLDRGVEEVVLREILTHAQTRKIDMLTGIYRPTPRNSIVRDHYAKLGFSAAQTDPEGTTYWRLMTHGALSPARVAMQIQRLGLSAVASELVG